MASSEQLPERTAGQGPPACAADRRRRLSAWHFVHLVFWCMVSGVSVGFIIAHFPLDPLSLCFTLISLTVTSALVLRDSRRIRGGLVRPSLLRSRGLWIVSGLGLLNVVQHAGSLFGLWAPDFVGVSWATVIESIPAPLVLLLAGTAYHVAARAAPRTSIDEPLASPDGAR